MFGLVYLMTKQLLMAYLKPKFDLFVKKIDYNKNFISSTSYCNHLFNHTFLSIIIFFFATLK